MHFCQTCQFVDPQTMEVVAKVEILILRALNRLFLLLIRQDPISLLAHPISALSPFVGKQCRVFEKLHFHQANSLRLSFFGILPIPSPYRNTAALKRYRHQRQMLYLDTSGKMYFLKSISRLK